MCSLRLLMPASRTCSCWRILPVTSPGFCAEGQVVAGDYRAFPGSDRGKFYLVSMPFLDHFPGRENQWLISPYAILITRCLSASQSSVLKDTKPLLTPTHPCQNSPTPHTCTRTQGAGTVLKYWPPAASGANSGSLPGKAVLGLKRVGQQILRSEANIPSRAFVCPGDAESQHPLREGAELGCFP